MPSPFPGMNPYLEQDDAWHDFHESFMPLAREILSAQVLPRYFVRIDDHVYVHEVEEEGEQRFVGRSDLSVIRTPPDTSERAGTELLEAPARVYLPAIDQERVSYLEVRDRHNRKLITVLELLSPSVKRLGRDRDQYLAKRDQLLVSQAHFVEIDLLRTGHRMPLRAPPPPCDYCVMVSRVEQRPRADLWPVGLRDRLPVIPVPLREEDSEARLDLQEVIHRIYDAAGYAVYVYAGEPDPPLSEADAEWASQFVPQRP